MMKVLRASSTDLSEMHTVACPIRKCTISMAGRSAARCRPRPADEVQFHGFEPSAAVLGCDATEDGSGTPATNTDDVGDHVVVERRRVRRSAVRSPPRGVGCIATRRQRLTHGGARQVSVDVGSDAAGQLIILDLTLDEMVGEFDGAKPKPPRVLLRG